MCVSVCECATEAKQFLWSRAFHQTRMKCGVESEFIAHELPSQRFWLSSPLASPTAALLWGWSCSRPLFGQAKSVTEPLFQLWLLFLPIPMRLGNLFSPASLLFTFKQCHGSVFASPAFIPWAEYSFLTFWGFRPVERWEKQGTSGTLSETFNRLAF